MVACAAKHEIHRRMKNPDVLSAERRGVSFSDQRNSGSAKMEIGQSHAEGNAPSRPALTALVGAMVKLSRPQRVEITRIGRKARAAKLPRIRRLTWQAVAEAKRLAREAAQ